MANYLYPDPASMDFFGEYMTPEIYPWMGQSTTSRVDRSSFSPLLFPQERPTTSPIIPAENLSRSIGEQTVIEPTDYRTEREKKLQEIENRIASSPISIQPYVSPKMADTQTNSNFMDNLGGLLFGSSGDGLEGYLTPDQQASIQRQALMQAAASLLKTSGPSTRPVSFGQILGEAYGAGTAGYQQAQQGAIQQLLTKQKLDEMRREQQLQNMLMSRIRGMTTGAAQVQPTAISPTTPTESMPTDGSIDVLPNVSVTSKPRPDIFSTLTPDQLLLAAMNPKTMLPKVFEESLKTESFNTLTPSEAKSFGLDPRGKWQQNLRTGQITSLQAPKEEYTVVTGTEAEKYGLSGVGKWQLNKSTNQATQIPEPAGTFGGGLQGKAYDIILEGVNSGKTDSVEYALAYRELSKPVPMEQVQPDGSIKTVYTQPEPLPTTIPKPGYRGAIPQVKTQATVVPSGVVQTAPIAPEAKLVARDTGIEPGVKSTPYAPTSTQVGEARKQILIADKLVSAIDVLEKDIKQNGMRIGGLGEAGGRQEAFFQDALLQLKELQNLGVLNGPDERILLNQLADPTSLISFIKGKGGPEYVLSKITELRNKAKREVTLINKQFPRPITTPSQEQSPAQTMPPAISDILKKYPPRK